MIFSVWMPLSGSGSGSGMFVTRRTEERGMGKGTVWMGGEFGWSRLGGDLTSTYELIFILEFSSYVDVEGSGTSSHQTHAAAARSKKPQPLPIKPGEINTK